MLPLLFEGLIQRVHSLKTSPSSQAPWQAMPVLIDRKIAADDGLPLTENQLTLSQTAIFVGVLEAVERVLEKHVAPSSNSDSGKTCDDWHGTLGAANAPGWLLGSILLHPLMQRLSMKQLLVLLGATMLLLSVGTITLPYIQMVSLTMLCSVRLVHGMCLNIQGLQLNRPKSWEFPQRKGLCSFWDSFWVGNFAGPTLPSPFLWWPRQYVYMQNCFPGYGSQLCSLVNALYSVVAVLMAILCGSLTLHTDWRLEAFVWFGLPILLGPDLAEKNMENTSGWHGTSWKHRINPPQNVQLFFFVKISKGERCRRNQNPESIGILSVHDFESCRQLRDIQVSLWLSQTFGPCWHRSLEPSPQPPVPDLTLTQPTWTKRTMQLCHQNCGRTWWTWLFAFGQRYLWLLKNKLGCGVWGWKKQNGSCKHIIKDRQTCFCRVCS